MTGLSATGFTSCGCSAVGCRSLGTPKGLALVPGAIAYWDMTRLSPDGQTVYDQSGNGNHATLGSTAGADTNDPAAGHTGLTFDGDDRLALPALPTIGAAQFVVSLPAPITPASAAQYLIGFSVPGGSTYGGIVLGQATGGLTDEIVTVIQSGGAAARSAWCSAAGSIAAGWHVLTASWSGAQYDIAIDGAAKPITNTGTPIPLAPVAPPASSISIGAAVGAASHFTGTVAACRLYPGGITAQQEAQNRAYWRAKWAPLGAVIP